ncbi:uncharacterized protein LOC131858517 [Cryptomeria japonica]|uniref:uncharacterized protein LOC131858517 n=1 Tax=Cryptomeria japonica TaxID=3369 RepID=UPI0027DA87E2|nr:uncharacterized protein LOC131858517 [Cryptomeria japonica]
MSNSNGEEEDDILDNLDPRCISQSGNNLLGRAKGFKGRKSNKQIREVKASEKGIVSVLEYMKNPKGGNQVEWAKGGGIHQILQQMGRIVLGCPRICWRPGNLMEFKSVRKDKLRIWTEIHEQLISLEKEKAVLAGDFNAILDIDDKEGGLRKSTRVMEDVREFTSKCQVVDVIPKNGMDRDDYLKEKLLKEQYAKILNREEIHWRDKPRALWIAEGNRNTKFFHATSKGRGNKNKIIAILDDEGILRSIEAELEQATIEYFVKLLGNDCQAEDAVDDRLSELVQKLVTMEEAKMLYKP